MNLNYLHKCHHLFDQTINRKERGVAFSNLIHLLPLCIFLISLLFHALKLRSISELIKRFRLRQFPQLRWRIILLSSRRLRTPAIASSPPVKLSILFSSCVVSLPYASSSIRICTTSQRFATFLRSHSQLLVGRSNFVIVNQSLPM